jgi:type IV pilus biogenesis protein CpaD/CtpE
MYPKVGKLYLKVGYNGLPYKPVIFVLTQQFMAGCTTKKTQQGTPSLWSRTPIYILKAVRQFGKSIGGTPAAMLVREICILRYALS